MKATQSTILLFLSALIFPSSHSLAQPRHLSTEIAAVDDSLITADQSEEPVYDSVDIAPQYPGGLEALNSFVNNNIQYPVSLSETAVQGRVIVKFIVKKDGSIGDIKVIKTLIPELDEDATRVIRMLSGFTPAMINGEPVNAWFTLPITYKLTC
ncbi:MAG: energy transducer TonB [Bacteroides sp.]|nr:energy transducer TonB [Bacteroides sp.]